MFNITINKNTYVANEFSYDALSDSIRFEYSTKVPSDFKNALIAKDALSTISEGVNEFSGYTKLTRFYAQYDGENDIFKCYITLEKDETHYEKLVSRITKLEDAKANMIADITALKNIDYAELVKEKLSLDEITPPIGDLIKGDAKE